MYAYNNKQPGKLKMPGSGRMLYRVIKTKDFNNLLIVLTI